MKPLGIIYAKFIPYGSRLRRGRRKVLWDTGSIMDDSQGKAMGITVWGTRDSRLSEKNFGYAVRVFVITKQGGNVSSPGVNL